MNTGILTTGLETDTSSSLILGRSKLNYRYAPVTVSNVGGSTIFQTAWDIYRPIGVSRARQLPYVPVGRKGFGFMVTSNRVVFGMKSTKHNISVVHNEVVVINNNIPVKIS